MGGREPTTTNSGPVCNANSGSISGCGTLDLRFSDAEAVAVASADTNGSTYVEYGTDNASLSGLDSGIRDCPIPDLFPSGSSHTSHPNPSPGSGFSAICSTSPSTTSAHDTPNTQSHCTTGSYAESLNIQIDLGSNNTGADVEVPAVPLTNLENVRFVPEEVDYFYAGPAATTPTTANEEIEPWVLALVAKRTVPDVPELLEHSSRQPQNPPFPSTSCVSLGLGTEVKI
jgi:hypothetical protein